MGNCFARIVATDGGPVDFYPMERRGTVYIIHNFVGQGNFLYREGGARDVGKLECCFKKLRFDVHCEGNLTSEEMQTKCKDWAKSDHSKAGCFILVILTHGRFPDQLQGSNGNYVPVDKLLKPFLRFNKTLVGKPKIFFIQACRGEEPNLGILDISRSEVSSVDSEGQTSATTNTISTTSPQPNEIVQSSAYPDEKNSGLLPVQADRLIVFSTVIGHEAYRDTSNGSWYIEELTKTLEEEYSSSRSKKHRRHLVDVLTEVQGKVSDYVQGEHNNLVQMPEFTSTLRGPIRF